jgi:hypothetical protein
MSATKNKSPIIKYDWLRLPLKYHSITMGDMWDNSPEYKASIFGNFGKPETKLLTSEEAKSKKAYAEEKAEFTWLAITGIWRLSSTGVNVPMYLVYWSREELKNPDLPIAQVASAKYSTLVKILDVWYTSATAKSGPNLNRRYELNNVLCGVIYPIDYHINQE